MIEILTGFNYISIIFRLIIAIIAGGLIGIEREHSTRSAGFRTHSMVCLGATLVMILGNYIYLNFPGTTDVARLGAQVVSGIGFLGAGAIITSGSQKVRGLTTAAALWTCGIIGLSLGIGFYIGGITACVFTVILLRVLKIVDRKYREKCHFVDIYLEMNDASKVCILTNYFKSHDIYILNLNSVKPKASESALGFELTIKVKDKISSDEIIRDLSKLDEVDFAHKVYV